MFCKACGKLIPDDSAFCSYCGTHQGELNTDSAKQVEEAEKKTGKNVQEKAISVLKGIAEPVFEASLQVATDSVQKKLFKGADKVLKKSGLKEKTVSERVFEGAKKGISKVKVKKRK